MYALDCALQRFVMVAVLPEAYDRIQAPAVGRPGDMIPKPLLLIIFRPTEAIQKGGRTYRCGGLRTGRSYVRALMVIDFGRRGRLPGFASERLQATLSLRPPSEAAMSRASQPELKKVFITSIILYHIFDHILMAQFMDKRLFIHLQGGRKVSGTLRGFDIFLNLVVDDATEETSAAQKTPMGTIVGRLGISARCRLPSAL